VLIDSENKAIHLRELTCCADRDANIKKARIRKMKRYQGLQSDINRSPSPWKATLETWEVCTLGNIPSETRKSFASLVGKQNARTMCKQLARIAIATSYRIFRARCSKSWHQGPLFELDV